MLEGDVDIREHDCLNKRDAGGFSSKLCGKPCDHGSPCTLPADHLPQSRHETEHGCTFYDDDNSPELEAARARSRALRQPPPLSADPPEINAVEPCPHCGSTLVAALRLRGGGGYDRCRDCGAFCLISAGTRTEWDVPLKRQPLSAELVEIVERLDELEKKATPGP